MRGTSACPARAPVVLVHGSRTSRTQWDLQLPGLEESRRPAFTPDLPGHGRRIGEEFRLEAAIATIEAAMADAARASPDGTVHLIGSSLGAMLAIAAAPVVQDRLASLVVSGASVQPGRLGTRIYGPAMAMLDVMPGGEAARRRVLRRVLGRAGTEAYLRGGRAPRSVIGPSLAAVASVDLRVLLSQVHLPVTILNGRFDQLRLQERSFAAAPPRGRLVVLPYGSHSVNLTHPSRYTSDLLRVIDEAEHPPR